ncbi:MAG TPA: hypothetical protein VI110_04590 [Lapillicoccus sp.]
MASASTTALILDRDGRVVRELSRSRLALDERGRRFAHTDGRQVTVVHWDA